MRTGAAGAGTFGDLYLSTGDATGDLSGTVSVAAGEASGADAGSVQLTGSTTLPSDDCDRGRRKQQHERAP